MKITYQITKDDIFKFSLFAQGRPRWLELQAVLVGLLVGGGIFLAAGQGWDASLTLSVAVVGGVVGAAAYYGFFRLSGALITRGDQKQYFAANNGALHVGRFTMDIADDMLEVEGSAYSAAYERDSFTGIKETSEHIFLLMGRAQGVIIPKRDLGTGAASVAGAVRKFLRG